MLFGLLFSYIIILFYTVFLKFTWEEVLSVSSEKGGNSVGDDN
jgi:hypothetical protein